MSSKYMNSEKTGLVGRISAGRAGPVARILATSTTAAPIARAGDISDAQYLYIGHPITSMR